ncbi:MAG: diaminopimelate epimerase [Ignavibacteria bacterium]|nr:diaminopimelate epimerase [Ignavibacteria bacterium]
MSGAGNLFTVLDNRNYSIPNKILGEQASALCNLSNPEKIRTEGLISLTQNSKDFAYEYNFFNPDGTSGMMCGNGGRCAAMFGQKSGFLERFDNSSQISFLMIGKKYQFEIINDNVKLFLPPPVSIKQGLTLVLDKFTIPLTYINVDSDHVVILFDDILEFVKEDFPAFDIKDFGSMVRFHEVFKPSGVNVNFIRVEDSSTIFLRTYERGVEDETGACGTGAISSAISAALMGQVLFPVTIIPTSGIPLQVDIFGNFPDKIEGITLSGSAEFIGEDEVEIEFN